MSKLTKWIILAAVVAGLVFLGVRQFVPRTNKELKKGGTSVSVLGFPSRNPLLLVRSVIIREKPLIDGINISGSLIPNEEVNLSFETSGKITEICFTEGTEVRKGTVLARINDAPLQAQLKKLEAQLKLNEDRLYRQQTLFEREAVSQETYQQAEASLSTLRAEIEEVNAKLAQTELKAPFDGIIGLRQVSVGAYASPNTSVATLTNTSKLKIEFSVPDRYAGVLKPGADLTFTVEDDPREYKAKVYATNSIVDIDTRTFMVRAIYDNSSRRLVPGRYVSVSLVTRTYPDAISVPSEAIVTEMGIDKVFLYKSGKAIPVEVTKGLRTDAEVQIVRGLSVGDTVISSGTMQLRTGMAVELKEIN